MKINPLLGAVNFLSFPSRPTTEASKDGDNGREQYSPRHEEKDSDPDDRDPRERMEEAMQAFRSDPQTQASGISATAEGTGPGLRVVVKDAGGAVIRQFTGDEFLRLRESVSRDQRARGKLIDQKL